MVNESEKVFLVFNTACIGDLLVTNSLVRNIKFYYPESKVVFICRKEFKDVASYQEGVDEVVTFDRKKDKSFFGILNFVKRFPYKKPFASFVTYSNERNLLISRLIGAKNVISNHKCSFWHTKFKYDLKDYIHMKNKWGGLIEALVGESQDLPIKYNSPLINTPIVEKIKQISNPLILCPTSNYRKKDMKIEDCIELIRILKYSGYTPILTGAGEISRKYSLDLRKKGCFDFIDFVDCTSFVEFANILKICNRCITVDTGTLHFANALNIPVLSVFYDGFTEMWAPDSKLYFAKTLRGYHSPNAIFDAFKEICQ